MFDDVRPVQGNGPSGLDTSILLLSVYHFSQVLSILLPALLVASFLQVLSAPPRPISASGRFSGFLDFGSFYPARWMQ
jgi:hypothetical protein